MAKKKRCPAGKHKSKSGKSCVATKPKQSKGCPTMKFLGRTWKKMTPAQKSKFPKRGKKTSWNNFVAKKRSGCA